MEVQPVLTPNGSAVFNVGGKHAWRTDTHKGFCVSFEWVSNIKKRKNPPRVLCIWRAGNVLHPNTENDGIWTISSNGALSFVGFDEKTGKCSGTVNARAMPEVIEGLQVMGYTAQDTFQLHALCDVLVRYLPDLMKMPPAPRAVRDDLSPVPMFDITQINKNTEHMISEDSI